MNNDIHVEEDLNQYLADTTANKFYLVLVAPSGNKVYSVIGWASGYATTNDWPHDTKEFNKADLKSEYYDIVSDTRQHPVFADATEVLIVPVPK